MDSSWLWLAAAIPALVWAALLAIRLDLLYACLACVLAGMCFPPAFGSLSLGPIAVSVDRLGFAGLLGFAVLQKLLTGHPRLHIDKEDVLLGCLLALLAVHCLVCPWTAQYSGDTPPWYRLVAVFGSPALVYWMTRQRFAGDNATPTAAHSRSLTPNVAFRSAKERRLRPMKGDFGQSILGGHWSGRLVSPTRTILGFLTLFGAYLACTAVAEVHGPASLVFPAHIRASRSLYLGRAVGPFLASPTLGSWLTLASAAAILLAAQIRGAGRVLLLALLPLFAYAEYLTATRSAWVGYAAGMALVLLLVRTRVPRGTIFCGLAGMALVGFIVAGTDLLVPDRAEGRAVVARSLDQRLALSDGALALFAQRPLTGWGFGQFEHVIQTEAGSGLFGYFSTGAARGLASHNIFLRLAAETGLVGLLLFLALLGRWLRRAFTSTLEDNHETSAAGILFLAALIAYLSEALFHDPTHSIPPHLTLFFLAGTLPRHTPEK